MTSRPNENGVGRAVRAILEDPMSFAKIATVLVMGTLAWSDLQSVKRDVADIKTILRERDGASIVQEGVTPETGSATSQEPTKEEDLPQKTEVARAPYRAASVSAYRFQLDDCHGSPGQLVVKAGVPFTIDNRDPEPITVTVAKRSYRIRAYGSLVTSVWTAGTHRITCNGGGAATLIVEK